MLLDHNYASKKVPVTPTKALLRKRVKRLKDKLRYREKRIERLEDFVSNMKGKELITDNCSSILLEKFSALPLELFKHEHKNLGQAKNRLSYSEEMRKMAVTLHFYSPRAYKYMRSFFNSASPPNTPKLEIFCKQ